MSDTSSSRTPRFVAVIPVGPNLRDRDRLKRVVDSLYRFEPDVAGVVVVDDDPNATDFKELSGPVHRLVNPRNRARTHGGYDGLASGLMAGYRYALEIVPDLTFVLKLDTDALVIAPFAQRIHGLFVSNPQAGIMGMVDNECDGMPHRVAPWDRRITKHGKLLQIWRKNSTRPEEGVKLRIGLFGRAKRIRALVRRAIANGYQPGRHAQGGAYAIASRCLIHWTEATILDDEHLWEGTEIAEDAAFSLMAAAGNFELLDAAYQTKIFAVTFRGLPMTLDAIATTGFAIAHSVKDDSPRDEANLVKVLLR